MFVIVHSGQTGVERGAHDGAIAAGLRVRGFMASSCRDELGPVPQRISQYLTPTLEAGPRAAIRANFAIADVVLVVVPVAEHAERFPATEWILRDVRGRRLPLLICDRATTAYQAAAWTSAVRRDRENVHVLVTGPRATRWAEGEDITRRLVLGLGVLGNT